MRPAVAAAGFASTHFPVSQIPSGRRREPVLPKRAAQLAVGPGGAMIAVVIVDRYARSDDAAMYRLSKQDRAMTDDVIGAADFRAAFRDNIPKRLARALSAPLTTARALFYRGVWPSRRREVAMVLAEQIEREMAELAQVRAKLARILEEYGDDVAGRDGDETDSATIPAARGAPDRQVSMVVHARRAHHEAGARRDRRSAR